MKAISLSRKDIYNGNLLLVNENYPINERFYDEQCMVPVDIEYSDVLLEFKTATVFAHLIDSIKGKDLIVPVSGYRTKSQQEEIYSNSLVENGQEFTSSYVGLAGHSEHQLGLAIDLSKKEENIDLIRPNFPYEGIYSDFRQKAPQYGFIERYKKDKEDITGIAEEPWHFRYVGYPHSKIIDSKKLCLEEYIDYIKEYSYGKKHFKIIIDGHVIEIFHLPILSTEDQLIHLKKDKIYQISGDNVDGCIVTLW